MRKSRTARSDKPTRIIEAQACASFPQKYNPTVRGEIAIGESVYVSYDKQEYCGEVFYIHPQKRFFSIVTKNGGQVSFPFHFDSDKSG